MVDDVNRNSTNSVVSFLYLAELFRLEVEAENFLLFCLVILRAKAVRFLQARPVTINASLCLLVNERNLPLPAFVEESMFRCLLRHFYLALRGMASLSSGLVSLVGEVRTVSRLGVSGAW